MMKNIWLILITTLFISSCSKESMPKNQFTLKIVASGDYGNFIMLTNQNRELLYHGNDLNGEIIINIKDGDQVDFTYGNIDNNYKYIQTIKDISNNYIFTSEEYKERPYELPISNEAHQYEIKLFGINSYSEIYHHANSCRRYESLDFIKLNGCFPNGNDQYITVPKSGSPGNSILIKHDDWVIQDGVANFETRKSSMEESPAYQIKTKFDALWSLELQEKISENRFITLSEYGTPKQYSENIDLYIPRRGNDYYMRLSGSNYREEREISAFFDTIPLSPEFHNPSITIEKVSNSYFKHNEIVDAEMLEYEISFLDLKGFNYTWTIRQNDKNSTEVKIPSLPESINLSLLDHVNGTLIPHSIKISSFTNLTQEFKDSNTVMSGNNPLFFKRKGVRKELD